jgi:hypothetical protein
MLKIVIRVVIVLGVVVGIIWASDRVSFQGERTVYSVDCKGGQWDGLRCTGKLVPGPQHRFRASKSRQEVLFWVAGSKEPSGKYTDCQVKDRGNWTCNMGVEQKSAIAYEMADGKPTRGGSGLTQPFHAIEKWKWWVLKAGIPAFSEASY